MSTRLALKIARRETRGGLRGFRLFVACLAIGVAAIAAVGTVRTSIESGLAREGAVLLGGDAQLELTYRFATEAEMAWMNESAVQVSEVVDFRSMAVAGTPDQPVRALTQLKAIDDNYPLYGQLELDSGSDLATALAVRDGLPGAVMQPALADRLGIERGDIFRLGSQEFRFDDIILREPDSTGGGLRLGPRVIVKRVDLAESGLLEPGTLFSSLYRLRIPAETDLETLRVEADKEFRETGVRWLDSRNGTPGMRRFVERLGSFLVIVGIAGLAVGGVGVAAAVRSHLASKTSVIATLRTLGSSGRTIFLAFLMQVAAMTLIAVGIGVTAGALLPLAFFPLIEASLPLPASFELELAPLAEAALYGVLTSLLFSLWALASTERVRAATLLRDALDDSRRVPSLRYLAMIGLILIALVGSAVLFSGIPLLAFWSAVGIMSALTVLLLASFAIRFLARRLARMRGLRGHTAIRLAFGSVGASTGETTAAVLSLGLGLAVLAAIGQIASNLDNVITEEIPETAPSFFFIDILGDQLDAFRQRAESFEAVSRIDSAPMLRGIITRINGSPAEDVVGEHWVLRGDRGVTYAADIPKGTVITEGSWWTDDYNGPPLVSFAEEEGRELGLKLGDLLTVNILGRDIEARIASFREVDFSTGGIGFIMSMNPAALAAAPHTHISTVYVEEAMESALFKEVTGAFPNVTAIRIKDGIERVQEMVSNIATAITYASAATLLTGFVVLIGAAAAGQRTRTYEAAILKTVGASRARILGSFALRSAVEGASAGLVAIFAGAAGGWAVMHFVMDVQFQFEPVSAVTIVLGGATATLVASLAFVFVPLSTRPAQVLRSQE